MKPLEDSFWSGFPLPMGKFSGELWQQEEEEEKQLCVNAAAAAAH